MNNIKSKDLATRGNGVSQTSPAASDWKTTLAKWLTVFVETYGMEISAARAAVYEMALSELSTAELDRCCLEAIRECRFAPTPADILSKAKRPETDATQLTADREWQLIMENLHKFDYHRPGELMVSTVTRDAGGKVLAVKESPLPISENAKSCVRALGGYEAIQCTELQHLPLLRKQFVELYENRVIREDRLGLTDGQAKQILGKVQGMVPGAKLKQLAGDRRLG